MVAAVLSVGAACATRGPGHGDTPLVVNLANTGAEPIRCQVLFGHWVERGLGVVPPGGSVRLDLMRARQDGGLYVMRPDGLERMMVETVVCGRLEGWHATLGQVDLTLPRSRAVPEIAVRCAAPDGPGRVACGF